MSKSKQTLKLEENIYRSTSKIGIFKCFEVTIGFGGNERVDFMTVDTKGIVRCYEVKSSKQDFYSKCKHTFCGNFNYFVMSEKLYEEVKHDIPKYIGVHNGNWVIKNPKKQELQVDIETILFSMVRSMSRDVDKYNKIAQTDIFEDNKKEIRDLKRQIKNINDRWNEDNREFNAFLRKHKDIRKLWNEFEDGE